MALCQLVFLFCTHISESFSENSNMVEKYCMLQCHPSDVIDGTASLDRQKKKFIVFSDKLYLEIVEWDLGQ